MHNSLNRVFRLVWNHRLNIWCVAPETARSKGKTHSSGQTPGARHGSTPFKQLPLALMLGANVAWAELPQGGQISAGDGSLSYQGNQLNVQQNSDRMAVDWQSFSIGKDNKVVFNQPGAESIALNRVLGADVSRIQGAIKANGQVFLLNPNGVLFSPTAQVNTGGLVASTLELSNEDFMAGNFQFEGDSTAAVTNQGKINVTEGGTIALIAATIVNEGSLTANAGNVLMGAGRKVTLDMGGPVKLRVDEGALNTLIEQGGAIRADGGKVLLTARAAGKLATSVINHTGITQAQTLATGEKGEIVLLGDMQQGQLQVAGTLDASAPAIDGQGGDGGFIETSAAKVDLKEEVRVTTLAESGKTGEWLIDPTDITITAGASADAVVTNLASTNVTLDTSSGGTDAGNIRIDADLSWSAANTLTLLADNDIAINGDITATNGGLTLNAANQITADGAIDVGTFNLQSGDWTQLGANLPAFSADGFRLSTGNASFLRATGGDGSEGNAYRIFDIYGLQGIASRSLLSSDFTLTSTLDASGTANWNGGAGFVPIGDDANHFSGSFDGQGHSINGLTINRPGTDDVGLFGVISASQISNIGLTNATITGQLGVGGLVGQGLNNSRISYSSVQGDISAFLNGGGLTGNFAGTIEHSHSAGTVYASELSGGLVADLFGQISDSYSTASVKGDFGGGLVGSMRGGQISRSYASGQVTQSLLGAIGGLIGSRDSGTITNSYWNTETSGQASAVGGGSSAGITGLTTAQMFDAANFTGFDFAGTWANADNQTTPYLRALAGNRVFNKNDLPTGTIDATNRPTLYTVIQNVEQLQAMRDDVTANYLLGNPIDATATAGWNGGAGFVPVGDGTKRYTGSFDGLGYSINGLTIDRSGTDFVSLFGATASGSVIRDIELVGGSVSGRNHVGGLVGVSSGTISNAYATGSVEGSGRVGGLVGYNQSGTISNAYATGSVEGSDNYIGGLVGYNTGTISNAYATGSVEGSDNYIGGLVGYNTGTISNAYATGSVNGREQVGGLAGVSSGTISNTYATGSVNGYRSVGGLVGSNIELGATIINAYATGNVEGGDDYVGGLVGWNVNTIINAYATGNVKGSRNVGGLVGASGNVATVINAYATGSIKGSENYVGGLVGHNAGAISNAYATGSVEGRIAVGGLAGYNVWGGAINNAYATGKVEGSGRVGGLVGYSSDSSTITNSYWNTNTSGQADAVGEGSSSGATGLTTAQMLQADSFAGWDIDAQGGTGTVWRIYEGYTAPLLRHFLTALEVTGDTTTTTYNGTEQAGGWSTTGAYDADRIFGQPVGGKNAGTYALDMNGLYSDQQGYDLITTNGTLTIGKAPLTIAAQDASKTYDGLAYTGGNGVTYSGFVAGEDASILDGTLAYGGNAQGAVNAGDYTLSVSGLSADNYAINYVDGTLTIGKGVVDLLISAQDAFKVYDGEAWFGGNGVSIEGLADGDTLADLNGTLVWGGTAQGAINAGEYSLTATGLSSPNYEIRFDNGTLTIGKADLQVNVVDAAKVYDAQAWSAGNRVSYDGFVGTDNETVLDGELNWGGSAQGAVNAGDYTLSASGLSSDNYNLSYQDGVLTVDKAGLTVNVQDAAKTYDGLAWSGGNGVTYDGFVGGESTDVLSGELSWGGTAQNAVNAGDYTLSVSGLSADNYTIDYVDGTLTVDKADLTVTANDALWVQDGSAWAGGNGVTYSGFVAGDDSSQLGGTLKWDGTAQGARDPGDYTLAASGLSADNYRLSYVDGQLQIISPMEAAGLPYRRAVQHAQRQTTQGYPRPEYVHAELKVVGNGIRVQ